MGKIQDLIKFGNLVSKLGSIAWKEDYIGLNDTEVNELLETCEKMVMLINAWREDNDNS